jgi:hypothetical protein
MRWGLEAGRRGTADPGTRARVRGTGQCPEAEWPEGEGGPRRRRGSPQPEMRRHPVHGSPDAGTAPHKAAQRRGGRRDRAPARELGGPSTQPRSERRTACDVEIPLLRLVARASAVLMPLQAPRWRSSRRGRLRFGRWVGAVPAAGDPRSVSASLSGGEDPPSSGPSPPSAPSASAYCIAARRSVCSDPALASLGRHDSGAGLGSGCNYSPANKSVSRPSSSRSPAGVPLAMR